MKKALILCTANSCRSQMAEGWLRHLGGERFEVFSAGIRNDGVNATAIKIMAEMGVDISTHTSDCVDKYLGENFDLVITVCGGAKESCPAFIGKVGQRLHWPFDDPADASGSEEDILDEFRRISAQIRSKIVQFLEE